MKKRLVAFAVLVSTLFGLTACGRISLFHKHEIVHTPYVFPTCTQPGYTESSYCATCNEVFTIKTMISAHGHEAVTDESVPATGFKTGLTEGSHCLLCDEILVPQQVIDVVPPVELDFPSGTITTEYTVIKTDRAEVRIPANVYVPGDLAENLDAVIGIVEEVSGLTFPSRYISREGRLVMQVRKDTETQSELEPAAGASEGGLFLAPMNLIEYTELLRALGEAMLRDRFGWTEGELVYCGFRAYLIYKTQAYVEENCPELLPLVKSRKDMAKNFTVDDYDAMYQYPVEHWMANELEQSSNGSASVGLRFMCYLDAVYGDFTRWITAYANVGYYGEISAEQEIQAMKRAYGEDVFDGFYPWLKENLAYVYEDGIYELPVQIDMTTVDGIQIMPSCYYDSTMWRLAFARGASYEMKYKDLWIDIETGKRYMSEYKGMSTEELRACLWDEVVVELYDKEGRLIRTETIEEVGYWFIDLDGVSYLKLVGEGILTYLAFYD